MKILIGKALCRMGIHAWLPVSGLIRGDGKLSDGHLCKRHRCQARRLTVTGDVPKFEDLNPEVTRAVQQGIRTMRREKRNVG